MSKKQNSNENSTKKIEDINDFKDFESQAMSKQLDSLKSSFDMKINPEVTEDLVAEDVMEANAEIALDDLQEDFEDNKELQKEVEDAKKAVEKESKKAVKEAKKEINKDPEPIMINDDIADNLEETLPLGKATEEVSTKKTSKKEKLDKVNNKDIAKKEVKKPKKKKGKKVKQDVFGVDTGKEIIKFEDVGLRLDKDQILNDINLDIYKGEFVYLVGASGAGKSSLIKMIYREVNNNKGTLYVRGENVTDLKNKDLHKLRKKVGVIFQDYKLLKDKTIFQNVAYSLLVVRYPRKKIPGKVAEVLKKVGIEEHANKYPDQLSGGQQQRAAIARAIISEPEILVADEPTGNLDPENALAIIEILEKINNEGTTIVMATHDVGIVNNFPQRVVLLNGGRIVKEATGEYIYE